MYASGWELPPIVTTASRIVGFGMLAIILVGSVLVNRLHVKGRNRTSGLVCGIVGKMGTGKSYAAVRMALDRLTRGVDVYSNFHIDLEGLPGIKGQWHPFEGWDTLATIRNAVVIVDEAHLLAPSHQHVNFPYLARWALAHGRHHGVDLYWIAQHEDSVNNTVRRLTNTIAVCESFLSGSLFRVTYYSAEDARKPKQHTHRRWYRLDLNIANRYDTTATIDVDESVVKGDKTVDRLRAIIDADKAAERLRSAPPAPVRSEVGTVPTAHVRPVVTRRPPPRPVVPG